MAFSIGVVLPHYWGNNPLIPFLNPPVVWGFHSGWWGQEQLLGLWCLWMVLFPPSGSFLTCMCCGHGGALSTVAPSCLVLGPENSSCPGLLGLPALSLQPWETDGLCLSIHPLHRSLETPTRKLGQLWGSPHLCRSPRRQCPFLPNVQCLKKHCFKYFV